MAVTVFLLLLSGCSNDSNNSNNSNNSNDSVMNDDCVACGDASCFTPRLPAPFVGNIWREEVETDGDFSRYWNQVTPENAGKWLFVETEQDVMDWRELDASFQFAELRGFPYKFHTLFWGSQQPHWLSLLTSEEQRAEIDQWVAQLARRYPAPQQIDVVNEPLHAPPGYSEVLGGAGSTGWDWVINAFRMARQSFPDSQLLLNDFNILRSNQATGQYLDIVKLLQAEMLIDGIGLQGHFLEETPLATISRNLDRLAATGLPIYISEYDVDLAVDEQQAGVFVSQFRLFHEHHAVQGITLWGYRENQLWQADAHLIREDGSQRPAMNWLASCLASE